MSWVCISDTVIHYKMSGNSSLPPALLIHELGGSIESWSALMPLVASRTLYAIDLKGAGASEKPKGPYSIAGLAAEASEFIAKMRPGEQWDIVGSALGAFVAAEMTASTPELVRQLTLSAIVPEIDERTRGYLADRAQRITSEGLASVTEATLGNSFPADFAYPTADQRYAYQMRYRCQDPASYNALALALANYRPPANLFEQLSMPTLVLAGTRDFIWSADRVREVARRIPDSRFIEMPNAGHFPHIHDPHFYASALESFWAEKSSTHASGTNLASSV